MATQEAPLGEPLPLEASDLTVRVGIGGGSRLTWERPTFVVRDESRRQILARASLRLEPGEFVAVIGESGAGKTTLLKALAGVARPSGGKVTVRGRPIAAMRGEVGYVPQENIVHDRLTVSEALRYAARLRLPARAGRREIEGAIRRVLAELDLEKQARVRIGLLSGGQRKRVAVGTELLSSPGLLFLDEPTTGLDPELESRMMALFRELADHGRTLVLATHATRNLALCDKLVVIGRGGNLAFVGTPAAALEFFRVGSFDAIYRALLDRAAHHWRKDFEELRAAGGAANGAAATVGNGASAVPAAGRVAIASPGSDSVPAGGAWRGGERHGPRRFARNTATLCRRYALLFTRDGRNLVLLLVQAPIIALAIVAVFDPSVFTRIENGFDPEVFGRQGARIDPDLVTRKNSNPFRAAQLLYALVVAAIFLGSINSAREVVKERTVVEREAAVGVGSISYLVSKLFVLCSLVLLQVGLMCTVVFLLRPLDEPQEVHLAVFGVLALLAVVAVTMGLCISAAARSQEQATGVIPLTLIPQLLFTGAIVPVAAMTEPVATLSRLAYGQPAFAGLGAAIDLDGRINADPIFSRLDEYGATFFGVTPGDVLLQFGAFLLLFLLGAVCLLPRRG